MYITCPLAAYGSSIHPWLRTCMYWIVGVWCTAKCTCTIRGWLLFLSLSSRYNYYLRAANMVLSGKGAASFERGKWGPSPPIKSCRIWDFTKIQYDAQCVFQLFQYAQLGTKHSGHQTSIPTDSHFNAHQSFLLYDIMGALALVKGLGYI
jgi:hypothetical protein